MGVGRRTGFERLLAVKIAHGERDMRLGHDLSQAHASFEQSKCMRRRIVIAQNAAS
jgi:hypothetical protein